MAVWRFVVMVLALAVAAGPAMAQKAVPHSREEVTLSYAPLVRKAAPAVVNIYTTKHIRGRQSVRLFDDPFFQQFFGKGFGFDLGAPRERVQNALGSGVIVAADGVVVTNHHVIDGADAIKVVLADRREFEAKVIGDDEKTDLAVLRIDPGTEALPFLELRDSDNLEVGDLVLAIGNPFGVGQTVTSGIVSALARTHVGVSDLNFFIQTDAAINPGNSGGALIGMDGTVVGINTAIFSKSGGSHGIGFAIPANMVRTVLAGFLESGRVVRPWLGAWGQTVTADMAASLGMERPVGVLVNDVYPGGPAERGGLRVGDVILSVAGHEIDDAQGLRFRLATMPVGTTAPVRVLRRGQERNLRVALEPPAENPPREATELSGRHPLVGATVANMSPALADEVGLDRPTPGVFVIAVRRGGVASRLGFQPGDQILEINGNAIERVGDLRRAVAERADRWRVSLRRQGKVLNWVIEG